MCWRRGKRRKEGILLCNGLIILRKFRISLSLQAVTSGMDQHTIYCTDIAKLVAVQWVCTNAINLSSLELQLQHKFIFDNNKILQSHDEKATINFITIHFVLKSEDHLRQIELINFAKLVFQLKCEINENITS